MAPQALEVTNEVDVANIDDDALEAAVERDADVLLTHLAKNGGSKAVDPYMLKRHAENSKRLNKGGDSDDDVSPFLLFLHYTTP